MPLVTHFIGTTDTLKPLVTHYVDTIDTLMPLVVLCTGTADTLSLWSPSVLILDNLSIIFNPSSTDYEPLPHVVAMFESRSTKVAMIERVI